MILLPAVCSWRLLALALVATALLAVGACGGRGNSIISSGRPSGVFPLDTTSRVPSGLPSPSPPPLLYVANYSANSVTAYQPTASGNAAPAAQISGSSTDLNAPGALGLDSSRRLYVLNASSIAVFAAGASGNVVPEFLIAGGLTQLSSPQGLAVEASGKVYVTNQGSGGGYITAYPAGSNGDHPPVQTIYDGSSPLFLPSGIAVRGPLLYVADQGDQTINEYAVSANGIVSPRNVISGLTTPTGVAVDSLGLIFVTDGNSVIVYAANASGNAVPLRRITGSATLLSGPVGLWASNAIFVSNAASNAITVYPELGNGNIKPSRSISGSNTGLDLPFAAAVR